jgi:hypothetical protein
MCKLCLCDWYQHSKQVSLRASEIMKLPPTLKLTLQHSKQVRAQTTPLPPCGRGAGGEDSPSVAQRLARFEHVAHSIPSLGLLRQVADDLNLQLVEVR